MLTIIVPMAGWGSRFQDAGYQVAKPLIPVHDIPMIEVVVNNLRPRESHRFVFVCQARHARQYRLPSLLKSLARGSEVVCIDGVTQGAACTVLKAKSLINTSQPLMIANCDQWINHSIDDYLSAFRSSGADGFIMTMNSSSPKWSYVQRGSDGRVQAVVEKQVVSDEATVGIYNFAAGRDFVAAAESMIEANIRVNNEFYVAPVFTRLIEWGRRIETFSVGADSDGMFGLGTPADLDHFLACGFEKRLAAERLVHSTAA